MAMIYSLFRFVLSSVKLWITILSLIIVSIQLYIFFYQWYIPHFVKNYPIFFQYDVACQQLADSSNAAKKPSLVSCKFAQYEFNCDRNFAFFQRDQLYDFTLQLEMPDSVVNRNLGMFMIRLQLLDANDRLLLAVARPALFPYHSDYVRAIKLIVRAFLYMLDYLYESYILKVDLVDEYVPELDSVPFEQIARVRIEIETTKFLEIVPPSELRITARLQGVKYWMYFWPITSFIALTSAIFSVLIFAVTIFYIVRSIRHNDDALIRGGDRFSPQHLERRLATVDRMLQDESTRSMLDDQNQDCLDDLTSN